MPSVWLGPKTGLIFHSDRGSQYCSHDFRKHLKSYDRESRQSMSRKGDCWDNAVAESFFATLKREVFILDGFSSGKEVEIGVFGYIESYYNRIRRRSYLGNRLPVQRTLKAA